MNSSLRLLFVTGGLSLVLALGCGKSGAESQPHQASMSRQTSEQPAAESEQQSTNLQQTASAESTTAETVTQSGAGGSGFKLGDLLEPFDPPTWEELQKVEWVDQPVLDGYELLLQEQLQERPPITIEEALKLRNDSPTNNRLILATLGRLPQSDDQVDWEATLNRHVTADAKSTNPLMISSVTEFDVSGLTSFGLFSFDRHFRPFAAKDTVVSWQTSKDHMMDKVVMRKDLVWSDGHPITAHDVVFSFKVIMSEKVPIPAVRSGTDQIRWVEAYDDYTLVFFHKEPAATNVWNINFPVIPRHIYERSIFEDPTLQNSDYHVYYEQHPISGGPYKIVKRVFGQEIELKRREDWYIYKGKQVRRKPFFETIRFRIISDPSVALMALKMGQIEEMQLNAEQWVSQTNDDEFYQRNTKVYATEWTYFYFGWNLKSPFFSDVRVRKAMSYAFDYDELFNNLLHGMAEPCVGIYHPASPWAPKPAPQPYKQDLDKAEDLLDEAGWTDHDGDGIRDKYINGQLVKFEFNLLTANVPLSLRICNLMRECLDQIGIICNVQPLEFTVLQDRTFRRQFHAYFGGWGTGTDPDTSENIWGTGQGRNFCSYSNPEVDRLFKEGKREFDPEKRAQIYAKIHKILWEDQPYTWLFYRPAMYGFNKRLRGYVFSPRGPYHYDPGFSSIYMARY